jgi:hypothetical protein
VGQVAHAGPIPAPPRPSLTGDGVKVGTFLGNYGRRFYGLGPAPKRLDVLWKVELGAGWSSGKFDTDPPSKWAGSGWTGQPNIVVDGGKTYVLASSYEYKLRRIDARTGEVVWAYQYDDIIKGSPSVFQNPSPTGPDDKYIVVAGSRRGYPYKLDDPRAAPLRAVTFGSGKELWRLPVPRTRCYSRDCDGSGFYYDGRFFIGVESGWFYALDPLKTETWAEGEKPVVEAQQLLLGDERAKNHGRNLVLESSASALGKNLYIASGAGAPTSRSSGTTSSAPTSTARRCRPGGACCSRRSRSSTSRAGGACCASTRPSRPARRPCGSSRRGTARSATGPAASSAPPP